MLGRDVEQWDGEGFSGQDKAVPALPPRRNMCICLPRTSLVPAAAGVVRKPRGTPWVCASHHSWPQTRCNSVKQTPGQPHPVSHPSSRTNTSQAQGRIPEPREGQGAGSDPPVPTAPSMAGQAGCYLPVSLVIHGDEIHKEHVVSHRVHPEYLHLEGGEHAPGTERRERRAELRGSREPRGAGAGTRTLPGPGVLRAG